jgi:hypothetical protein
LRGNNFASVQVVGSRVVELGLWLAPALIHAGQAMIVVAVAATVLRPEVVPPHRVAFFGTAMALISSEAGGYTQILIILFVFMERWRGIARPVAIVCCYVLCLPGEIMLDYAPPLFRDSYLAGRTVEVHLGAGLGMFLRPGLIIATGIALSMATIRDVWLDVRTQGWRHRWRFRHDAPLLPGIVPPLPAAPVGTP